MQETKERDGMHENTPSRVVMRVQRTNSDESEVESLLQKEEMLASQMARVQREKEEKLTFSLSDRTNHYTVHRDYWNLPLANKTNVLWEYFIQHKKKALENLKSQISKPPFPMSLWETILVDQYIDLNKLYAIQGKEAKDEETVHESRQFKFIFNQIQAKFSINDQGAWGNAFNSYTDALIFAYPHHEGGL